MLTRLRFSLEVVNGDRLGKLAVPLCQVADWINFLACPHYGARILFAEQNNEGVTIYFDACEGLYGYLGDRISTEARPMPQEPAQLMFAG